MWVIMGLYDNYEQVHLYHLTLLLYDKYSELIPDNCDSRCIYSTIINRAYYSAYSCSLLWLEDNFGFKLKGKSDFNNVEDFQTEHKQVILELKKVGKFVLSDELRQLKRLRKIADYEPLSPLTLKEVQESIDLMKDILSDTLFN